MLPDNLEQWLQWQMSLHDQAIDLGLDRVSQVGAQLGIGQIAHKVVTVAGTNGKGSSVAVYESWLHQAGHSVASYTSPHLMRYNERVKFACVPVSDAELCGAFAAVETARQDVALTYFEFGTLAALYLIQQQRPDYALLEVGLGGRLDAVNIVDADLVHLTPIGIDHQSYLGHDREQIGYEKAGVLRPQIPVIVNDAAPPTSVMDEVTRLNCRCLQLGRDYTYRALCANEILWCGAGLELIIEQALSGAHQGQNLAGVVAGLTCLVDLARMDPRRARVGFDALSISGRLQQVHGFLAASLYADVGHNRDAASALARSLAAMRKPAGKVVVLLGMLEDKDVEQFVTELKSVVDHWWLLSLRGDRGLSAERLQQRLDPILEAEHLFDSAAAALEQALSSLSNQDIMLVTGSFVTVEMALRALPDSGH